ncbi:MAG: hypothetical protein AB1633_05610, partial [Elusimicrobiota bacterium]
GTIGALNSFTEIYAMTQGGPPMDLKFMGKNLTIESTRVTGFYLFRKWERLEYGYAASISYLLLIITLLFSYGYTKILKK